MGANNARRVWNPTEYLHRSKDPGQSRVHMDAIEQWRENALAAWPTDIPTREAIKLEAHFRQMVMAFMGAEPLQDEHLVGNAIVTALAGTLGVAITDAVLSGMDREKILATVLERATAVVDFEVARITMEKYRAQGQ